MEKKMLLNVIEQVQLRTSFLGIIERIIFDMSKVIKLHKHKNKLQVEWMIRGIWNDQKLQKTNIRMWPKRRQCGVTFVYHKLSYDV